MSDHRTAKHLAREVYTAFAKSPDRPTRTILEELFELMYFASLKSEESELSSFDVVYLNPSNPDPNPPKVVLHDRFRFVPFPRQLKLTISNLIKLAKASDPRTSSLVVYPKASQLFIWGLVDQGNRYYEYITRESTTGPARPGIFQSTIVGPGHLIAWMHRKKVAELKVDTLITKDLDVLSDGPIREALNNGLVHHIHTVRKNVGEVMYEKRWHNDQSLTTRWLDSICRLLLRIQRYRHGGAILITPDRTHAALDIKYKIDYDRLPRSLERLAAFTIENTFASDEIFQFMDEDSETIPMNLYLDESVTNSDIDEITQELANTIWFISLLTRVDGLVLLDETLVVKGFGIEISITEEPANIRLAQSRFANENSRMKRLDYNHYGTRHRSMMRYCYRVPGSVGFVVSQDGDVRAMTRVGAQLIVWDGIKLQVPEFLRRAKRRAPRRSKTTGQFV